VNYLINNLNKFIQSCTAYVRENFRGLLEHIFPIKEYPNNCIKGIPDKNFLTPDKTRCGSHLFHFKIIANRNDKLIETSINWEDDSSVIEFTFNQSNPDGNKQFKAGIALIPRIEIDKIKQLSFAKGRLSYERRPEKHNKYHGNLLLREDVPNHVMKQIAANIALIASEKIILRSEYEDSQK
jgi:hypothetical protein